MPRPGGAPIAVERAEPLPLPDIMERSPRLSEQSGGGGNSSDRRRSSDCHLLLNRTMDKGSRPELPQMDDPEARSIYTAEVLDYMCGHIEKISSCIEDVLRSGESKSNSPLLPERVWKANSNMNTAMGIAAATSSATFSVSGQATYKGSSKTISDRNAPPFLGRQGTGLSAAGQPQRLSGRAGMVDVGALGEVSEGLSMILGHTRVNVDKSWPMSIPLRSGLTETSTSLVQKEKVKQMMLRSISSHQNVSGGVEFRRMFGRPKPKRWTRAILQVQDPNSTFIRLVEIICPLVLLNDVIMTPYILAWDIQRLLWVKTVSFFSAIYWTFFLISRFFTGYYEEGELVMDRWRVAKYYLRHGFTLDFSLTLLDWVIIGLPASAGQTFRYFKMFRMFKVVRLARVWKVAETLIDSVAPVGTRSKLVVHLFKVAISTTVFSHIMSCAWYAFGRHGYSDTGVRWLELSPFFASAAGAGAEADASATRDATYMYEYSTCFHWTLAQLTLGSADIYPTNTGERMFNVALLLTGIIFNATIVSLISSQAVEYIANRRDQTTKFQTLCRFLEQHKVETKLAVRVQRQVMDRMNTTAALIPEDDVTALAMISSALRDQLMYQIRVPHILGHELFRVWWQTDATGLKTLCEGHVSFECYKTQDFVFVPGPEARGMMRVVEGQMKYTQDPETSKESEWLFRDVNKGENICEAALWSVWKHVGKLECYRSCFLLCISADGLIETVQQHPVIGHMTRQYGRAFHLRITCSRPPFTAWPNDLVVPNTNPSDLLEQDIGLELIRKERLKENGLLANMQQEDYFELVKEVEMEKCAIQTDIHGVLERIVPVFTIKIKRPSDNHILVEVGKFDKGAIWPSCALPGSKRPRGELPEKTYERVLLKDLNFVAAGLCTLGAESQVEVKESQHFGMLTKYLRTVQHAELSPDFTWPRMPCMRAEFPVAESPTAGDGYERSRKSSRSIGLGGRPSFGNMARRSSQHTVHSEVDYVPDLADKVNLKELSDEPVWLRETGDKVRLYCWLSEANFEFLKSHIGKARMSNWLAKMDVKLALGSFNALETQEHEGELAQAAAGEMYRAPDYTAAETAASVTEALHDSSSTVSMADPAQSSQDIKAQVSTAASSEVTLTSLQNVRVYFDSKTQQRRYEIFNL
mmetsp:Transcript_46299/g.107720  ORF Transcript_46299/g.107720 Transcript_46299/m.107720 type:complete len:1151 (+) Transcript_46299:90-3542(+)